MMLRLSPVTRPGIEHVAARIRHPNVEQYLAAIDATAEQVIEALVGISDKAWECRADGVPVAVGGLRADSFLSQSAELWLFTTDQLPRHSVAFLRACRQWVGEAQALYPRLYADVDTLFEQSIAMLRWLGFVTVGRKQIAGMGADCIVMERN